MARTAKTAPTASKNANVGELAQSLMTIRDNFRAHQNDVRRKYKVSSNEMEIVLYINTDGPQRMKNIANKFGIKFSTLTSLVDKLEGRGLVKRVSSKDDRRSILVTLTKKGEKMLGEYNDYTLKLAKTMKKVANGQSKNLAAALQKASEA